MWLGGGEEGAAVAETGSMVENLRDSHEPAKDRDLVFARYGSGFLFPLRRNVPKEWL